MESKTIVYIPIENLLPHKDNPRQNVGDVSELAESIKAKGVLQNLTVVPSAIPEKYTVIIGHRRLAAAKLAGLKELPCTVVEMSYEDQVATMLVENMQRSDLTIYEEAKGFQMMLNLGKTVQDVSAMSGFSESTVRRRVKLADLDEKKFKKAVDRGATLFDFAELDKIEDPEKRNDVLGSMGTSSWKNKLEEAIADQDTKKLVEKWSAQAREFATELDSIDWDSSGRIGHIGDQKIKVDYVRNYNRWGSKKEDVKKPDGDDDAEYFFTASKGEVSLYRKWRRDLEAERKEAECKERADKHQKLSAQLKEISERHRKLRLDFVLKFDQYKQKSTFILEFATEAMIHAQRYGGGYYNSNTSLKDLARMLGIDYKEDHGDVELNWQDFTSEKIQHPERTALITAMWILDRGDYYTDGWDGKLQRYRCRYEENTTLDRLYMILGSLGYISSPEEVEMRRGIHKLLHVEEEES